MKLPDLEPVAGEQHNHYGFWERVRDSWSAFLSVFGGDVIPSSVTTPAEAVALANDIGPRFGSVTLAPLGSAGEWARFAAVQAVCAANGWALYLAKGNWICDSKQLLAYPCHIEGVDRKGTRIVQTLVPDGDQLNAAFAATVSGAGAPTTLSAAVVLGSRYLQSNAPIATAYVAVNWAATAIRILYYTVVSSIAQIAKSGDALAQVSAVMLNGVTAGFCTASKLYVKLSVPGGNATAQVYKEVGLATLVAHGALVGDGGGTITLVADGGSGITGTLDVPAGVVASTDTVLTCDLTYTLATLTQGVFDITVDRPIVEAFQAADVVTPIAAQPHDIVIKNMTLSGTGDRRVELRGTRDCLIEAVDQDDVDGAIRVDGVCQSYDTGGFNNRHVDCHLHGSGVMTTGGGIALESQEWGVVERCEVKDCGSAGPAIAVWDGWSSGIIDSYACGSADGAYMGSDGASWGCIDCYVRGGVYEFNTNGVVLSGERPSAIGVTANYNTQGFENVSGGAAGCVDARFVGCSAKGNTNGYYPMLAASFVSCTAEANGVGFVFTNGAGGSVGSNLISHGNTTYQVSWDCDVTINGLTEYGAAAHNLYGFSGTLTIFGFSGHNTRGVAVNDIQLDGGSILKIFGGANTVDFANSIGVYLNGATSELHCDNFTSTATQGLGVAAGAKVFASESCGFAGTIYNPDGLLSHFNWGTFTLNGVNEVDVVGNFAAGDTVKWSLNTVGATPGNSMPYFDKEQAAGHFYVKSPTANANDVYNWRAGR